MQQIRSFIAIELPEEVKMGLRWAQDRLKSADPASAKWVDPNSIHLTLKFLGNVDADKIGAITEAMQDAAMAITPFNLKIAELGCFPNLRRVQIVWVGLNGDIDKLQVLQNNIESYVAPLGFPTEKRPFTPHLTLARIHEYVASEKRQAMGEVIAKTQIEPNLTIKVNSISLMRSQLTRAGAFYTRLCSVELKPSCQ